MHGWGYITRARVAGSAMKWTCGIVREHNVAPSMFQLQPLA